jgi:butyryl-CoA dehydrogenase
LADTPIPDWPGSERDPEWPALDGVAAELAALDGPADEAGTWSEDLWRRLAEAGAPRWSLPRAFGGAECDRATIARRYARLAEGSLTAAFILTQHDAAVRRLASADAASPTGHDEASRWLGAIGEGRAFATVGISQLTTSRRYGAAALAAVEQTDGAFRLDGVMPWVTAAGRADLLVAGAVLEDSRQMLVALPPDRPGVSVSAPMPLAALQASCTAEVRCAGARVEASEVLSGPSADVMSTPGAAGTGGLETSALALGQARAALVALAAEIDRRDEPEEPVEALARDWQATAAALIAAAEGRPDAIPPGEIRRRANALVLRATQAYLTARKGTGFLRTEPAQRWARQALFFLVWSCPSAIARAAIRDLAGLCAT